MRLGICLRTWGEIGGIGVYTRSLLQQMLALGRDHEYVLFFQERAHLGAFTGRPNVREVHVPTTGRLKSARTWIWDQVTLPYHARRQNVDVIFHTKFAIPLPTRRKTAMVLHGTQRFVHPELHEAGDMWFFRTVYPHYLRRASLILAVSERGRQDVIRHLGIDPHKVRTVHLAANPLFRVLDDAEHIERVARKYNLPRRFIVYVGHICPGKNVDRLFKALARVRQHEDVDLVLAGGLRWGYESDLALLPKLGLERHVHLVGHVPHEELVVLYNRAELMAFPSFYESFPAPPLEANACGCPVITSPTGGTPESAGDAALYVEPTDEQGLAEAMLRVLGEPRLRAELVDKGFRNVQRFSWEQTARRTLDALESLVS
jgi:glycosyltransferase involved in cell wall biosynthesis